MPHREENADETCVANAAFCARLDKVCAEWSTKPNDVSLIWALRDDLETVDHGFFTRSESVKISGKTRWHVVSQVIPKILIGLAYANTSDVPVGEILREGLLLHIVFRLIHKHDGVTEQLQDPIQARLLASLILFHAQNDPQHGSYGQSMLTAWVRRQQLFDESHTPPAPSSTSQVDTASKWVKLCTAVKNLLSQKTPTPSPPCKSEVAPVWNTDYAACQLFGPAWASLYAADCRGCYSDIAQLVLGSMPLFVWELSKPIVQTTTQPDLPTTLAL